MVAKPTVGFSEVGVSETSAFSLLVWIGTCRFVVPEDVRQIHWYISMAQNFLFCDFKKNTFGAWRCSQNSVLFKSILSL